jgi:hypothetical protein
LPFFVLLEGVRKMIWTEERVNKKRSVDTREGSPGVKKKKIQIMKKADLVRERKGKTDRMKK